MIVSYPKADAQPSYEIKFVFKLYDNKGHVVNKAKFAQEYTLIDLYSKSILVSTGRKSPYNYHDSYFDPKSQCFVLTKTVVPSLYKLSVCHKKDTMTIYLEASASIYCDSLILHKGKFLVSYECGSQKEKELPSFIGSKFHLIEEDDWECYRALFEKEKQDDLRLRN